MVIGGILDTLASPPQRSLGTRL